MFGRKKHAFIGYINKASIALNFNIVAEANDESRQNKISIKAGNTEFIFLNAEDETINSMSTKELNNKYDSFLKSNTPLNDTVFHIEGSIFKKPILKLLKQTNFNELNEDHLKEEKKIRDRHIMPFM